MPHDQTLWPVVGQTPYGGKGRLIVSNAGLTASLSLTPTSSTVMLDTQ